ncbi:Phosphoglycerate mutase OS=Streptomyces aurantiogriseus OX=66870 GN=GCM10010251_49610 PE=4 SV=1 [Streptomyces aurantiogriseus]
MTICLTILRAVAGDDTGGVVFDDGALSKSGLGEAGTTVTALPRYSAAFRGPSARCAQTAQVLGLKAALEPALRDFDYRGGAAHNRRSRRH